MSDAGPPGVTVQKVSPFVGRDMEIGVFERVLVQSRRIAQLVFVHGTGGIGKTTYLREAMELARRAGLVTVWVDGRTLAPVPRTFLEYLQFSLSQATNHAFHDGKSAFPQVLDMFAKHRVALVIDNCEQLGYLEGWFREVFLRALLQTNTLLLMASRHTPGLPWQIDETLHPHLTLQHLTAWKYADVERYAHERGLFSTRAISAIMAQTAGHPLAVGVAVDGWQHRGEIVAADKLDIDSLTAVNTYILQEVASPRIAHWLEALSMLPEANYPLLQTIVGGELASHDYHELTNLSFVHYSLNGLALHDDVRQLFVAELKQRDRKRYEYCRERVARALIAQHALVDAATKVQIATQVMQLYQDNLPHMGDDAAMYGPGIQQGLAYLPSDLACLHQFLEADKVKSYVAPDLMHAMLDEVAVCSPDSIQVVRSEDGDPLAFWLCIWIHGGTTCLLDKYTPEVLAEVLRAEQLKLRHLPREQADTNFCFMFGMNHHHPHYTDAQVARAVVARAFPATATGVRILFAKNDAGFVALLRGCGFDVTDVSRKSSRFTTRYPLCQIDCRDVDLASWYERYVARRNGDSAAGRQQSDGISLQYVNDVLKDIRAAQPATQASVAPRKKNVKYVKIKAIIMELLSDAIDELARNGMSQEAQQLLAERYLDSATTANDLANRHHVSRAVYYRRLHFAMEELHRAVLHRMASM